MTKDNIIIFAGGKPKGNVTLNEISVYTYKLFSYNRNIFGYHLDYAQRKREHERLQL